MMSSVTLIPVEVEVEEEELGQGEMEQGKEEQEQDPEEQHGGNKEKEMDQQEGEIGGGEKDENPEGDKEEQDQHGDDEVHSSGPVQDSSSSQSQDDSSTSNVYPSPSMPTLSEWTHDDPSSSRRSQLLPSIQQHSQMRFPMHQLPEQFLSSQVLIQRFPLNLVRKNLQCKQNCDCIKACFPPGPQDI